MHALSFVLKRAHLRAVETHKPLAAKFGLTPARFDVLAVIRDRGGVCRQSDVWTRLGVSGVTISRMLRALDMFVVEGIYTSIPLHQKILRDEDFISGQFDTNYIARRFPMKAKA